VPYVSLDLETTGLDPETDEIIEIAAIRFDASGVLDTYQTLVNPGRKLEYRIAMLTGIDPAALETAPHFGSIAGGMFVLPVVFILLGPDSYDAAFALGVLLVVLFALWAVRWQADSKRFLSSTEWAKAQEINSHQVRS